MTIVARNNITVSNVNDGTITHYAYANSADGKDGFYVGGGTNLLINSNFSSGLYHWTINPGTNKDCKAVVTTDSDGDTCIHITGTGVACGIYSAPAPFNQNQITTGSVLAKGTGRIMLVGLEGRPASNFGTVSTESYSKVGSTTQARSNTNSFVVYFSAVNDVVDVYIKFVKLEQGDKDTPWSPAPSEAHPSYIGQYSDFSSTASTDPAKYTPWIIFKGNDGVGIKTTVITYSISTSGTTAPSTGWTSTVPSLVKGQYLWTKTVWTYTDNSSETGYSVTYISKDGIDGDDGLPGKDGTGIQTTTITYASSTSGTTAPSTGWTSAVPTVPAGSYLWTKTVWAYTDNTSETGYSVAMMGLKGDPGGPGNDGTSGIIVSSVAPDSPQTGQLWQDTSTTPQLVKKWTGNEWVIWAFYAQNLKADSLETVSAIIGKISNTFDNSSGGVDNKGTITIEDSIKVDYYNGNSRTTMDLVASSSGQGLFTQHLPDKTDTSKFKQSWYMPTGLYFTDSINNWNGQITAENVTLVPWTNLTYLPGFTTSDGIPCQYRKLRGLDGSYRVEFKGRVRPTSGGFPASGANSVISLPASIIPTTDSPALCVGDMSGVQTIRVFAFTDGRIQTVVRGTGTSFIDISSLFYTI